MDPESGLFLIEEGFWLKGQEHFLAHLDERCLLAFPQAGEMHGVFARKDVAATATPSNRISYRADVTRSDGQPYSALVSSAYVRRPSGWKLAFHQHSPD